MDTSEEYAPETVGHLHPVTEEARREASAVSFIVRVCEWLYQSKDIFAGGSALNIICRREIFFFVQIHVE
jgi:hypothetical protein